MERESVTSLLAEAELSADEFEAALRVVVEQRRSAKIAAKLVEDATMTNGFKHYFLANPKFPFEKILMPGTNGSFYAFFRGRILIDSPGKEELVRNACGNRLHEEDLKEPKRCRGCGTLWFSTTAHAECQLSH